MAARTQSHFVERLTWDDVRRCIEAGAPAILPIGAGAKEHGLHLPLATDRIQAEWLARWLAGRIDALIWPTISYGHYPAFTEYAGSTSLSANVFESMVAEIAGGMLRHGCRAVLVLDTGISTIPPVDRALSRLDRDRLLHLRIYEGPRFVEAAAKLAEQRHGSHADEIETSLMLTLAPHLVDMARAEASARRKRMHRDR